MSYKNMKHLVISVLCTCLALAATARVPMSDVIQPCQVSKNESVTATTPMCNGKSSQVSLMQLVRERNVANAESRMKMKVPNRVTTDDMEGIRISVSEASAIEFDDGGFFWVNDTIYCLGEKSEIKPEGEITNVYEGFSIPFMLNNNGDPCLYSYYDVRELIGTARTRIDTIQRVYFYTSNDLFNGINDTVPGQICDDGTIVFGDSEIGVGAFYFEEVYYHYRNYNLVSIDSICMVSPFFRKISLLIPNGVHKFTRFFRASPFGYHYKIDQDLYDTSYYVSVNDGTGSGSGIPDGFVGPKMNVVCGGGGLAPRPIGGYPHRSPAKPNPLPDRLDNGNNDDAMMHNTGHVTRGLLGHKNLFSIADNLAIINGGGGFRPRPPQRPLTLPDNATVLMNGSGPSLNSFNLNVWEDMFSREEPVYMYQADDSTLFVYNLFGFGSTVNCMKIHQDASLTFPGQAIYYDDEEGDIFNFSLQDNMMTCGNSGYVSSDSIFWDDTYFNNDFYTSYTSNRLTSTDGSQFLVGFAQVPSIEVAEGDDAFTFTAVTAEEGAELYLYTLDDEGMIIELVDNPYVVMRTYQDQVINLGVVVTVPGKNDNYYMAQYQIPGKANEYQEGDLNHDGKVSIVDVATLINFLLNGHWEYSTGK